MAEMGPQCLKPLNWQLTGEGDLRHPRGKYTCGEEECKDQVDISAHRRTGSKGVATIPNR